MIQNGADDGQRTERTNGCTKQTMKKEDYKGHPKRVKYKKAKDQGQTVADFRWANGELKLIKIKQLIKQKNDARDDDVIRMPAISNDFQEDVRKVRK